MAAARPTTDGAAAATTNSNIIATRVRSWDEPSEVEKSFNIPLEAWKETQIEPKEESDRRYRALKRLDALMRAWIRHVMINDHRMSEKDAARYEGKIYTTGSYRYNVHTTGSDIDAVLIAPMRVTREHFFDSFAARLEAEPLITEVTPVKTARVPIIAIKFDGIEMDLSFGSIQQEKVPDKITDDLLRGLDDPAVRSANAPRVAHQLLEYAPVAYEFRTALRFIKLWAKVRGIHGSQYGFPTGIGWAILVCYACQCYPKKNAAGILASFFKLYRYWYRPDHTNTSIYLSENRITSTEFGRSWDPHTNRWDQQALFPVLTPVAPSTNSCEMVTKHTLRILCKEFTRGHDLISAAMAMRPGQSNAAAAATAPSSAGTADAALAPFGVWSTVLEPYPFFESHQRFLHIKISTVSAFQYVERYKPYVDCIESRLNRLLAGGKGLDQFPHVMIRPWPKRFEDPQQVKYVEEAMRRHRLAAMAMNDPVNQQQQQSVGGAASPNANRGSIGGAGEPALAPLVPVSSLLTAHIFIGIDIDPNAKKTPTPIESDPLFAEALQVFIDMFVNDMSVFRHGVTQPPQIKLVSLADIPLWIFDPSKSKVLKQRAEEAALAKIKAAEEEERRQKLIAQGIDPDAVDDDTSGGGITVIGDKRPREEGASDAGASSDNLPSNMKAGAGQRVGFAGIASITATMATPSTLGIGARPMAVPASAASAPQHQPFIAVAQSVVSSTPIIAAPTLTTDDVDIDDELGMDF